MTTLRERLLSLPEDKFQAEVVKLLGPTINPIFVRDNLLRKTPKQLDELLDDLGEVDINIVAEREPHLQDLLHHSESIGIVTLGSQLLEGHQKLRSLAQQLLAEP